MTDGDRSTLFVWEKDWQLVRGEFDESERKALRKSVVGQVLCPRGVVVDVAVAGDAGEKLRRLLEGYAHGEAK